MAHEGTHRVLWHYTTIDRLQWILASGELRPAALAGLPKVKPTVWFSASHDWDPSANRVWQRPEGGLVKLSKDQTIVLAGGLARIAVDPALATVDWKTYKAESGLPSNVAQHIYNEAVSLGSRPGLWYATYSAVPGATWQAVEVWEDEQWVTRR